MKLRNLALALTLASSTLLSVQQAAARTQSTASYSAEELAVIDSAIGHLRQTGMVVTPAEAKAIMQGQVADHTVIFVAVPKQVSDTIKADELKVPVTCSKGSPCLDSSEKIGGKRLKEFNL